LLNNILAMNQELLRSSEVQVHLEIPDLPELQLNKSKMTQVLVNLVRNAVQAMQQTPSDERYLRITASIAHNDGLELQITDRGMGFGPDVQKMLFTHGFTTKGEGNGFGLHYCANAIRESGGSIRAERPGPGQGATFSIYLPQVMPSAVLLAP